MGDMVRPEGWWAGYLAFENYQFLDPFNLNEPLPGPIPGHWFGFFPSVLVLDHREKRAFIRAQTPEDGDQALQKWQEALSPPLKKGGEGGFSRVLATPDKDQFADKILTIKKYLAAGDAYQINLTEKFHAFSQMTAGALYQSLRAASPVPYGAFLNAGDFQILSASPESFLQIENGRITTRPIKGTRCRISEKEDPVQTNALLASEKDKAELLMITDLERNDLGKICETGSVTADPLFEVESFAQVHHLVATVSGKLKKGIGVVKALEAVFPGGSVTGAPKIRALQIIKELENEPRSVYTGALGFIGPDGEAKFNLPIRSMTKVGDDVYFHAGCGIVIDSDAKSEFEEMQAKASGMLKALGL